MTRERHIRKALVALKPQVLASMEVAPGARFEKCFDLAVSHVVWNVYDGHRTIEDVLPYLTRATTSVWDDPIVYMDLPACAACGGDGQVCSECEKPGAACQCPESSLPTPMPCPACERRKVAS